MATLMREERRLGAFGYGLEDSDSDEEKKKRFKAPKLQDHQRSIARPWVQVDMLDSHVETAVAFVEKKREWKQERNKREAEFLGLVLDTLVREVAGGDFTYLLGTDTMELLVRRLLAVMTVDNKSGNRKAWEVAQSVMAPVQRVPGIYMDPAVWHSAEKAATFFASSGARTMEVEGAVLVVVQVAVVRVDEEGGLENQTLELPPTTSPAFRQLSPVRFLRFCIC